VNKITAYFKESVTELKRVQWPSKEDTIRLTGYVIGVSAVVGLLVTLFDFIFKKLLGLIYF
jgi:preprotein translocase subunit SecE